MEKCLWGSFGSLVFLFEDLLQDVLSLLNQVLNVFLDFSLIFVLKALKDIINVALTLFEFFIEIKFS